ncbi:MAG: hypothetical protein LUD81_11400 [Clostridiales bacterium]|nr:hypothetical protein [Clostridiales bacterium]
MKITVKGAEYASEDNVLKARLCGLMGAERGADFFKKYKRRQSLSLEDIKGAKWSKDKPDRELPSQKIFTEDKDIQIYISSLIGSDGAGDDIKKAIMKWLLFIKIRPQAFTVLFNRMSENARRELTAELYKDSCFEMINTLTAYAKNTELKI